MLKIRNLKFSYGSGFNLNIEKFDIEENSLNVIIGPNGSGKTTFAKIISGLIDEVEGLIEIDSRNLKQLSVKNRSKLVSYINKRMIKDFNLSVNNFAAMGRYAHKNGFFPNIEKEDESIIDEVLHIVDLSDKKNRLLNELSDGEFQRACVAKVLCQQTAYTILDEPTSALDLGHIAEILELLKNFRNRTTFIVILHDINEAIKIYDNLICMDGGKIECVWHKDEFDLQKLEKLFKIKLNIFEHGMNKVVYF